MEKAGLEAGSRQAGTARRQGGQGGGGGRDSNMQGQGYLPAHTRALLATLASSLSTHKAWL